MRRMFVHMHTTLNNRIANAAGGFWQPFPWGEPEMTYLNEFFRRADTWAMSRKLYEAIVPWWDTVASGDVPDDVPAVSAADREFAAMQKAMTKLVFSRTLPSGEDRTVVQGDLVAHLGALKRQDGRDIVLSCGPGTLAPLAAAPGLIDGYVLAVHPAVITSGPDLFADFTEDLTLELTHAEAFDGGATVLHYQVPAPSTRARHDENHDREGPG